MPMLAERRELCGSQSQSEVPGRGEGEGGLTPALLCAWVSRFMSSPCASDNNLFHPFLPGGNLLGPLFLQLNKASCLIAARRLAETFWRALLVLPIVQTRGLGLQRRVNHPHSAGLLTLTQVPCCLQATCFLDFFLHLSLGFPPYH